MQVVHLVPIPYQMLKVRLDNQYFNLSVYQKNKSIFLDASIGDLDLVRFVPCLNLTPTLCREYFNVRGQLMMVDTLGTDDPNNYSGLGTRWFLVYFDAEELPLLTIPEDPFNDPLTGLPVGSGGGPVAPVIDLEAKRAVRIAILEARLNIYQDCGFSAIGSGNTSTAVQLLARGTSIPPSDNQTATQEERIEALESRLGELTETLIQMKNWGGQWEQFPVMMRGAGGAFILGGPALDERLDSIQEALDSLTYTVMNIESPTNTKWILSRRQ